jgi:hypothetical protein
MITGFANRFLSQISTIRVAAFIEGAEGTGYAENAGFSTCLKA